jgi:hypothetical protein
MGIWLERAKHCTPLHRRHNESNQALCRTSILVMSNRSHLALAICVSMPKVFADRFAALEDTAPFDDYESISTSNTASKSIVKSLSFVISWIVAILVLRVTVLLVGKAYTWLTIRYVNMRDDLLADHGMDERSRVKRLYKDSRSVGSIGSVR